MQKSMSERSLFSAVINCKCPQCREGSIFTNRAYNLKSFTKMPEDCPVCDFRFEREPGFFYGSMYVSYALSVGIFLVTVVILQLVVEEPTLANYIISVSTAAVLLYPLTFRYARVIFLNIFGGAKYDPTIAESKHVS